ncbi:hypothetical protein DSCW_59720 [Desulfosarcina widdelii]|uniref:Amino acid permease n=2 Tax=Desulfosarcina widdelii TaxID=947919 RepID=A0A5K7ZCQ3_9BACT|nr:hypothetical protein DSCW_59720 [Desulfosarcina widdelii]
MMSATATPLASIFGSGFLVIVPISAGAVGPYAWLAMICVCGLAYAVGSVIRFNIRHTEPMLEAGTTPERAVLLEKTSDLALVVAYAISVCLYIRILASFLLGGLDMDTPIGEHIVTVAVIGVIGIVGYTEGLDMLQNLEKIALGVTLLIIVALLAGFAVFDINTVNGTGIQMPNMPEHGWWQILTLVGGTLIVVQGFETSRYLEEEFDTDTRIRSCRLSQILSTVVYVVFILLATPLMHFLGEKVQDNALIMLAGKASALLPVPLVIAVVLSQFSAAVEDTIGGGGNMVEATRQHVDPRHAYLLICGVAILVAFFNTLTVLALASRAFAFYYTLQCLVAFSVSKSPIQKFHILLVAMALGFITLFAVPAS